MNYRHVFISLIAGAILATLATFFVMSKQAPPPPSSKVVVEEVPGFDQGEIISQPGTVNGRILEGVSGKPLEGVEIKIAGTRFETKTDSNGRYEVEYVPGGVEMLVYLPDYTQESRRFEIITRQAYPAEDIVLYNLPKKSEVESFLLKYISDFRVTIFGKNGESIADSHRMVSVKIVDSSVANGRLYLDCILKTVPSADYSGAAIFLDKFSDFVERRPRPKGVEISDHFQAEFHLNKTDNQWTLHFAGRSKHSDANREDSRQPSDPRKSSSQKPAYNAFDRAAKPEERNADRVPANATESTPQTEALHPVDLSGTWIQYFRNGDSWVELGRFLLSRDQNSKWSMQSLSSSEAAVTPPVQITNIAVEDSQWSFDSDWGEHGVAKFELSRTSEHEFRGWPYLKGKKLNQENRWLRISNK